MAHDYSHTHVDHDHHGHSHAPKSFGTAFAIGVALNMLIVIAELVFGFAANSLALIADAAHNFSDVIGLLLAWGAAWLALHPPTKDRTYGYRRASILAALGNAALLMIAIGGLTIEAVRRFQQPETVASSTVMWVALLGIVVNAATALLFMRGRHGDLNIRGAFMHMAADAGISLGVVLAALVIMFTGWHWIDPAISLAIAAVVLVSGWHLARDAINLAMDAVPEGIDQHAVEVYLSGLPGVTEVHDLHIWAMSTTETALTVHLIRPGAGLDDHFLTKVCEELAHHFRIKHATLQVEAGDPAHPCTLAPAEVV